MAVAIVLGVLLVAAAGVVAWQDRRLDDERAEREQVEAALARAERQTPTTTAPGGGEGGDDLTSILESLLGGEGLEGLEGIGGLEGLGGAGGADLAACLGESPPPAADVPDSGAPEQVAAIADAVQADRGITFEEEVEPVFLDDAAITDRLETLTREDYSAEEADLDSRRLALLGAVEPGTDLLQTQLELLSAAVAGFYDPATGELVVRSNDTSAALGGSQQVTLAHELEHALADQAFALPVDDEAPEGGDAARAALAVIEGDATLTMQRFSAATLGFEGQLELLSDPAALAGLEALQDTPAYLAAELQFPYTDGLSYVCSRYADGGWGAVDGLYEQRPPSTAAVLFPDQDVADPVDAPAAGSPGDGWEEARTDQFGAAELLWLLSAPGNDPEAAAADAREQVRAWGGGEAVLWTDGDDTALSVALAQAEGQDGLCATVTEWYGAAFPDESAEDGDEELASEGDGHAGVVRCDGAEVVLGLGPDIEVARNVAGG